MADEIGDNDVTIWHHGLIAKWWANFNLDGPEIDFFRAFVAAGQPALDVGCGSGRLLVPWVASGLVVDGVDASADMINACRDAAALAGHEPKLYVQPSHLLDLPQRYGTIVMCGSFGLGVSRQHDLDGLRRAFEHLRPGGLLALDYELSEFDSERLATFRPRPINETPPLPHDRRLGPDGFHYALRLRFTAIDVEIGRVTREMQAWQWSGDQLVGYEIWSMEANVYKRDDVVGLLQRAGFADVEVVGGYHGGTPHGDERFLVYLAHRDS